MGMDPKLAYAKAEENLRKYWGYPAFRPGQDTVIKSVFSGQDTLVLFPTGGGKSLCYQVPATVLEGLTLVISPLVALMQDQVDQLTQRGISATFINSTISRYEVEQRLVNARNGMYKLLYCAPERLQTTLWESELDLLPLEMVAIDEAHCISEWGHDFRPSYREIKTALAPVAEDVRWIALTATATPEVRTDITENLQFSNPRVISKGFARDNLKYWVDATQQKEERMERIVRKARGSGLIYAGTRRECERLAAKFSDLGIPTSAYHAGYDAARRKKIQQNWISGKLPLVAATNAFGMGIDKPDCRYVIHKEIPNTLEAYYQEAGRAGRDGKESYPVLLYKPSDYQNARSRIESSYPTKKQLQQIYDALCDSLELAVGSVREEATKVSVDALAKHSGLPPQMVRSGLEILAQLGTINQTTYFRPQIGIHFLRHPDAMADYIERLSNNRKAQFIDLVMRQFGPESFQRTVYLETEYLETKLEHTTNAILKGLTVLEKEQVLTFEYIGDQPMIELPEARVANLPYTREELEKHRDRLLKKLEYVKGYAETDGCRSRYIRIYFGEENVPERCNFCDNCLQQAMLESSDSGEDLTEQIKQLMMEKPMTLNELVSQTGSNFRTVEKLVNHLKREELIDRVEQDAVAYRWKS